MNRRRFRAWPHMWLTLLVFVTYAAAAATVVINALDLPYRALHLPSGLKASADERSLAAAQLVALHRARSGAPFSSLPVGTTVEVRWPDGSRETLRVVDPKSPNGLVPMTGMQDEAR